MRIKAGSRSTTLRPTNSLFTFRPFEAGQHAQDVGQSASTGERSAHLQEPPRSLGVGGRRRKPCWDSPHKRQEPCTQPQSPPPRTPTVSGFWGQEEETLLGQPPRETGTLHPASIPTSKNPPGVWVLGAGGGNPVGAAPPY